MIEIDGSYGEGGGQILRTALTLSAITQKEVSITGIRAGRPKPGLAAQHVACAKAVRSVCRGTLEGAEIGGSRLVFRPGRIVGGKYEFDIGTAGSVTLVAQTLLPILMAADKESGVRITGGTHVMKSPGYDYFAEVFLPAIRRMGADVECRLLKPGYYPAGGGVMEAVVRPSGLKGCASWPRVEHVSAIIRLSGLPESIAVREKKVLVQNGITDIRVMQDEALSPGNAVTLWAGFRGAYVPGEKGKRAEAVAQEALDALRSEAGEVDRHLADQLLIYAALADGKTTYEAAERTAHAKTNAYVISRFIERGRG